MRRNNNMRATWLCTTQVQQQFQREMGRAAVEARVDAYMRSHTVGSYVFILIHQHTYI